MSLEGRNKQKVALPSSIKDGWFSETEPMWPGQKLSIALEVRFDIGQVPPHLH